MLSAVFREIFKVPVHFSVNAHCLQTSHSAHTHLHMHLQIYTHTTVHKQINLYADRLTNMLQWTHTIALSVSPFSFPTSILIHAQTLTASSWSLCVYVSGPTATPLPLLHSLYPSFGFVFPKPSSLWIIQSSIGVESAHKVENTINDSIMFQLYTTRGLVSNCGGGWFA